VTVVVANPAHRYPLACGADPDRLGLRLIEGPLAGARRPIFQTSANRSGKPAPARFDEVDAHVLGGADLAIDGGELTGLPSTVVDVSALDAGGDWTILREGALDASAIEQRLGAISSRAQ
jgi:L-threonylcarbamoyladenylate synthase